MCGGCRCNLTAKITTGAGAVSFVIGIIVAVIAATSTSTTVTDDGLPPDVVIIDGLKTFTLSRNDGILQEIQFLTTQGTSCQDHLSSLTILHIETWTYESLSYTCGSTTKTHDGLTLRPLGEFWPLQDWGTYSVTSDYLTWVSAIDQVVSTGSDAPLSTAMLGVAIGLFVVGSIFFGVAGWCSCRAAAAAPPIVVFGTPQSPQAPVVVMAKVVGQGTNETNENMA